MAKLKLSTLSALTKFDQTHLRNLSKKGDLPKNEDGWFADADEAHSMMYAYVRAQKSSRAALDDEKLRKTTFEADALEREKKVEEGDLLTIDQWRTLVEDTIPPLRQHLKTILTTEIPATCSGLSEPAIRARTTKIYSALVRRLHAGEQALNPTKS